MRHITESRTSLKGQPLQNQCKQVWNLFRKIFYSDRWLTTSRYMIEVRKCFGATSGNWSHWLFIMQFSELWENNSTYSRVHSKYCREFIKKNKKKLCRLFLIDRWHLFGFNPGFSCVSTIVIVKNSFPRCVCVCEDILRVKSCSPNYLLYIDKISNSFSIQTGTELTWLVSGKQ